MQKTLYIFVFIISTLKVWAEVPKREMRAVWVTTVANIDFPSQPNLSTEEQKQEIRQLLDLHQADGINAIIFQVRPAADAFYQSEMEPWSRYLCGKQGQAPTPFYDPLAYIIEEAHKRHMELHAWVNPFRVRSNKTDQLVEEHPYMQNKWWGWDYNGKTYFDPGIPDVREHTMQVVLDIVRRYDIDGIHFDDYFYPYRSHSNAKLPDENTFRRFGGEYYPDRIEDWRRENINILIRELSQAIKEEKAWVKFGISPFGIWKNTTSKEDKLPTKNATSNYDILYADVIKWLKEGWIDYCAPQLYWAIGYKPADYAKLLKWWNANSYGRNMYIGHSLYKINSQSEEEAWRSPLEIERQIDALRQMDHISGSIFYSSKHLTKRKDVAPLREALRENYYKYYSLMPTMAWIDDKAPDPPRAIQVISSPRGNRIAWEAPRYKSEMDKAYRYIIYKVEEKSRHMLNAENIGAITDETNYYLPPNTKWGYYLITAIDRMQNESKAKLIKIDEKALSSIVFQKEGEVRLEAKALMGATPYFNTYMAK